MFGVRKLEASTFVTEVVPWLSAREVENNVMIGIAQRLARAPETAPGAVLAAVEAHGALVGAVICTPPHFAIVTALPAGAAGHIASFFRELGFTPDGAYGPADHGRNVACAFAEALGRRAEKGSDEILYELVAVRAPARPAGGARLATEDDLPLLTRLIGEFFAELGLPHPPDATTLAERRVASGSALLWEDGEVRALACEARRMTTGAAIAPVYTVPSARGRGYGSAVTAELCQRLLDDGCRFVCLHAERKNPTSNRIYQAIGFRTAGTFNSWIVR